MIENTVTTETWTVTFGLGTLNGGRYSEIVIPAGHVFDVAEPLVRGAVVDLYGTAWAFIYPPSARESAIDRWNMERRERVEIDALGGLVSR